MTTPNSHALPPRKQSGIKLSPWLASACGAGWSARDPIRVYVYADEDQGEMRIIAALAGEQKLLEVFDRISKGEKVDPHAINGESFFGAEFIDAQKRKGESQAAEARFSRIRDFAKCVIGTMRVAVPGQGLVQIKDLGKFGAPGEFTRADKAQVINSNGRRVSAQLLYNSGVQPTTRVITSTGFVIEGSTDKHSVQLASGEWRKLADLKLGDVLRAGGGEGVFALEYVRVPINPWGVKVATKDRSAFSHEAPRLPSIKVDEDWGYLLGALHGGGSVRPSYARLTGLPVDGVLDRAAIVFESLGLSPRRSVTHRTGYGSGQELEALTIESVAFTDFLTRIGFMHAPEVKAPGRKQRQKVTVGFWCPWKVLRVPDLIFRSPASVVAAYLAGLYDTDGAVTSDGFSLASKSEEMLQGVKLLLCSFGVQTKICAAWNATYQRNYYNLQASRFESIKLRQVLGPEMACKRKIASFDEKAATWSGDIEGELVDTVEKVEDSGVQQLYDLTVEDGHSYVANGLVNHNTGYYCVCYGSTFDTYYETLTSAEDNNGNLPFVHYGQKAIRATYDNWMKSNAATVRWWETEPELYRKQGFLSDLLWGYRCDFLDGEEDERQRNKLLNFRSQSTLATIVHSAALELTDGPNAPIPFQCYGPGTGLVINGHDRLDFELPTFHPRRWADPKDVRVGWCEKGCACPLEKMRNQITDAMTRKGSRRVPGLPVDFTAVAKVVVGQWV